MSFSQSRGNRSAWLSTASVCKCSISLATLLTVLLREVAYCYPLRLSLERLVYRPLRLVQVFLLRPGWS